jgi:hypothetical protein
MSIRIRSEIWFNWILTAVAALALLGALGCSRNALGDYSLRAEAYPNVPECRQAYFKGKAIPGVFLEKLNKADGPRVGGLP